MNGKDVTFLEDTFKKFYFEHFDLLHVPDDPNQREFGYQKFNGGMNRHISLKSDKELHLLLMQNKPSDVYCSNARYMFPNLPMSEKDWQNAELIFDIDAKDLRKEHPKNNTLIKCSECNEISELGESCPKCNSTKLSFTTLTCDDCINSTKDEVLKLNKILIDDLGINEENIKIFFSGNEGFHIYVHKSEYENVGSRERAELSDYIMFRGGIPETFGFRKFNTNKSSLPKFDDVGWNGRLAKHLYGTKSNRSKISQEVLSGGYALFQKKLENFRDSIGIK
ncbi:DNA primase, partial [Candidatus Nitrosopelagicus sp.]|nr:DNA primase [Candidatus Nitrosopelagicus sp.]